MRISRIALHGYRGLSGEIRLAPGLNILLGPNASGKTSIIEAGFIASVMNYADLRLANSLVLVLHASRGSLGHSMASQAPGGEARVCVEADGSEACTRVRVSSRLESRGVKLQSVVSIEYSSERRVCRLVYEVYDPAGAVAVRLEGGECTRGEASVGLLTPGVIPYNYIDAILGELKAREPRRLDEFAISAGGVTYRLDVASDEWGGVAVYAVEDGGRPVVFYSLARGIQRALQLLVQLRLSSVVFVDELEAAMHPELLETVAGLIAGHVEEGRQVILATHSLEAVYMLVAALLGDVKAWRKPEKLHEMLEEAEEERLERLYAIHILGREGGEVRVTTLRGKSGVAYTLGVRDPRLSYRVVVP